MPRRNRINDLLLATLLAGYLSQASALAQPQVIGYDRFHSDSPSEEGGRLLFNELGCVNCHNHPTGLPERKGPILKGITNRLATDWIREFLLNPPHSKPGTAMPQMHLSKSETEAVIHFLASLESNKKTPKAFKFVNATRGIELYHNIGCVSCHAPDPDFNPSEGSYNSNSFTYPHIPFPNLSEKYDIHSLSAYLNKPHDYSPHGRMPQFALEREDPGDLAAYLLGYANGDSTDYPKLQAPKVDASLAQAGKDIVVSKNCAACHDSSFTELPQLPVSLQITPYARLPEDHPDYNLSAAQQESIDLFLSKGTTEATSRTHLESLNCVACHDRNGLGGPDTARKLYFTGNPDLGDAGRYPPPLTDAGRKFQSDWLDEAIRGRKPVRPYLNVQMPDFGPSVQGLSTRLISDDENAANSAAKNTNLEQGRKLLGTQGGLNCITCHGWGERRSLGIEAIDLSQMHKRLKIDWLYDYLINPGAYRPNTLMPSFWPNGIASNREILDGDPRAQIEAIYSFSKYGEGVPEGFPDLNTSEYEIVPTTRPVVQRSFLEGVGTHALLVGFPEKIHYAIGGKTGRPAMMWKGRFFDAYRTWFSRFPEFEAPLGKNIVLWPDSLDPGVSRYQGYRLDEAGVPEFVSELLGAEVYERLKPVTSPEGAVSFHRTIRYTQETQLNDPRLHHPQGVQVTEINTSDPLSRKFHYQW